MRTALVAALSLLLVVWEAAIPVLAGYVQKIIFLHAKNNPVVPRPLTDGLAWRLGCTRGGGGVRIANQTTEDIVQHRVCYNQVRIKSGVVNVRLFGGHTVATFDSAPVA